MTTDAPAPVAALRSSHDRLAALVEGLGPDDLTSPSYDTEWTIAQVLSHLGSQNEIFTGVFDAVLAGTDPPGPETFPPVWEVWNAKSPEEQAKDFLRTDADMLHRLQSLDEDELATPVSMFGMQLDVFGLVRMRLSEHTLHSWDVAVMRHDAATLPADATAILVDQVGPLAARAGTPAGRRFRVAVRRTEPERAYVLRVDEDVDLSPGGDDDVDGRVELPAEALIRLVAGRLDPDHTPADVRTEGVALDDLRAVFPGL
jgi:uncharacterized protein (TIGR03083 family)